MNINASTSFTVEQQSGNRNKTQPKSDKASSSRSFSFVQKRKCFSRKKADLVLDIGGMYIMDSRNRYFKPLKTRSKKLKSDKIEILFARCNKF